MNYKRRSFLRSTDHKISRDFLLLKNYYNDIDLQLQLADNYMQLKQYHKAEKCLRLAHEMIPNRFIPLYRLVLLYKEEGKINTALRFAHIIVGKPVKVLSIEVLAIKKEMNKLIQKYST